MYRSVLQGAWGLKTAPLIPNDPQTLRGLAGVPEEIWEKHGPAVMKMFELSEDQKFYSHERLSADWREAVKKMREYTKRASMGGKAKQAKRLTVCSKSALSTPQAETSKPQECLSLPTTEHNTTGQNKEEHGDAGAPELPPLALAHKVCEELCLQGPVSLQAAAGAIQFLEKFDGRSPNAAVEFLIAKARDALDRGETVNRFWFDDRKWRPRENGNGKPNTATERGKKAADEINSAADSLIARTAAADEETLPAAAGGRSVGGMAGRLAKAMPGGRA